MATAPCARGLVSRPLAPVQSRAEGHVKTFDWRKEDERNKACNLLNMHAAEDPNGPQEPILIKHAVSNWQACKKWDLGYLLNELGNEKVQVRCAPSMKFYYVERRLVPAWKKLQFLHRQKRLPSILRPMTFRDFHARLQTDSRLPHVYFPDNQEEFYYLQTNMPIQLYKDLDLYSPPISCLGQPGMTGENGTVAFMPSGMHVSQYPRIFISPQGSVSPLHFDTSSSFLVQIRGRKRLLFYSPKNLDRLYTYGGLHILRRRSRVDPCNPDFKKYPKFKDIAAHEAILEPGDVLWFPDMLPYQNQDGLKKIVPPMVESDLKRKDFGPVLADYSALRSACQGKRVSRPRVANCLKKFGTALEYIIRTNRQ